MKRFLSSLLCAVLMLGMLPVVSQPARMIIDISCTLNKTSACVGDTLTWTVAFRGGTGPFEYSYQIYRNDTPYSGDSQYHLNQYTRNYTPPEPGTYKPWVVVKDNAEATTSGFWGPSANVSLRPATKITKVESMGGTSLKVSWNKISGAAGYFVERSTSKTGPYKTVKVTTATIFTNTYLKAGTRYYYRVRSYNLCDGLLGKEKCSSSSYSLPAAGVPLAKPVLLSVAGVSATGIKLTWTKATGATGYQVFRSATPGGVYKLIKTTNALNYTAGGLKPRTAYWFKVRAYKQFGTVKHYGPLSGYKAGRTR